MVTHQKTARQHENRKILLTGVFGPFGVKDEWAEGVGMQMELLNNQITREQGIHSPRQFYYTLALYFLAENISVPSTVLDFPLWEDFKEAVDSGHYTHVGINFIVPNVEKAARMARYVRQTKPHMKILLGGYGTGIPDLQEHVPHDAACRGEGISWIRRYFGDDPHAEIVHPMLQNPIEQRLYGYKTVPRSSVLVPGLGCRNGCEFCVTSHSFDKRYIPLLKTGQEIFDCCMEAYESRKASGFTIMDENFLKEPQRARELLALMEEHRTPFVFEIFSSAETINEVGIEFLVRLGVKMVWVGVESRRWAHQKTAGLDLKEMVRELQSKGISVNTSAILFLDHHTPEEMEEDVKWVLDMGADLTQFMNYTPLPGTALTKRLQRSGQYRDLEEFPYRYHTGVESSTGSTPISKTTGPTLTCSRRPSGKNMRREAPRSSIWPSPPCVDTRAPRRSTRGGSGRGSCGTARASLMSPERPTRPTPSWSSGSERTSGSRRTSEAPWARISSMGRTEKRASRLFAPTGSSSRPWAYQE